MAINELLDIKVVYTSVSFDYSSYSTDVSSRRHQTNVKLVAFRIRG